MALKFNKSHLAHFEAKYPFIWSIEVVGQSFLPSDWLSMGKSVTPPLNWPNRKLLIDEVVEDNKEEQIAELVEDVAEARAEVHEEQEDVEEVTTKQK